MTLSEQIALKLLDIHAIKLRPHQPFTWASGLRSPIYCDNRTLLSFPAIRNAVIDGLAEVSGQFEPFDAVSGVATAGIAHGALLAQKLGLPFSYVRSRPKEHGRQNQIEGRVLEGQRILVVEDLISTGGSSIAAVEALRSAGCEVAGVVAIFEYLFDEARRSFEQASCRYATLTNYEELIRAAESKGLFKKDEIELLRSWHIAPKEWSKEHGKDI